MVKTLKNSSIQGGWVSGKCLIYVVIARVIFGSIWMALVYQL